MRSLKRILVVIEIIIIIVTMILSYNNKKFYAHAIGEKQNSVKVGVLLYRFDDPYISLVAQSSRDSKEK